MKRLKQSLTLTLKGRLNHKTAEIHGAGHPVPDEDGIKGENKTVSIERKSQDQGDSRQAISILIPQSVIDEYRCREKAHRKAEKKGHCLAWGAIIVGTIYAAINLGVWLAMLASNRQSHHAFEAIKRPYVSLGRADGEVMRFVGSSGKILMYFQNAGGGPARHVHIDATSNLDPPRPSIPLARWYEPNANRFKIVNSMGTAEHIETFKSGLLRSTGVGPDLAPGSVWCT